MSAFYYDKIPQLATDIVYQGGLKRKGYFLTPEELGQQMHDLNVLSLSERYGDKEAHDYKHECTSHTPEYGKGDLLVAIFHRLSCYLYQSCEGDADKQDLYKTLSILQTDIAISYMQDHTHPPFRWGD